MLDSAVVWFGITIENALHERVKVGSVSQPKYTLARLLNPATKLPRPPEDYGPKGEVNVWAPLLAWAGKRGSGVKRYRWVPPEERGEAADGK